LVPNIIGIIQTNFLYKGFVKVHVNILHFVDWSGRHETPAGVQVKGDPTGAESAEEDPGLPAESEVPGAEINRQV
jgi:hypothetical protein